MERRENEREREERRGRGGDEGGSWSRLTVRRARGHRQVECDLGTARTPNQHTLLLKYPLPIPLSNLVLRELCWYLVA